MPVCFSLLLGWGLQDLGAGVSLEDVLVAVRAGWMQTSCTKLYPSCRAVRRLQPHPPPYTTAATAATTSTTTTTPGGGSTAPATGYFWALSSFMSTPAPPPKPRQSTPDTTPAAAPREDPTRTPLPPPGPDWKRNDIESADWDSDAGGDTGWQQEAAPTREQPQVAAGAGWDHHDLPLHAENARPPWERDDRPVPLGRPRDNPLAEPIFSFATRSPVTVAVAETSAPAADQALSGSRTDPYRGGHLIPGSLGGGGHQLPQALLVAARRPPSPPPPSRRGHATDYGAAVLSGVQQSYAGGGAPATTYRPGLVLEGSLPAASEQLLPGRHRLGLRRGLPGLLSGYPERRVGLQLTAAPPPPTITAPPVTERRRNWVQFGPQDGVTDAEKHRHLYSYVRDRAVRQLWKWG